MALFNPEDVDSFTSAVRATVKYRMAVAYAIADIFYHMQKFGALQPIVEGEARPDRRILESARYTYENIPVSGELTIPVHAYDFGVHCEFDEDGEPIGEWPEIGRLVMGYTGNFLMPAGKPPPAHEHLQLFRLSVS